MKSRIMYAIVLLLTVFMFVWTGSKEAFFLLAFLMATIPVFAVMNLVAAKKISIMAQFVSGTTNVKIEYENKSILFGFNIETRLHLVNAFTDSELSFVYCTALFPKSKKIVVIPVESDYCGRIEISISESTCVDLIGFSRFKVNAKTKGHTYVYPELVYENEEEIIKRARENTSSDTCYQNRKGNDITEILNIREYVKGDSMKNIHWKLSLKQKEKLVREFDMPVNQEVLVLFALSEERKNLPEVRHILAQNVLGVVDLLYSEQIFFDSALVYGNGVTGQYTIDSEEAYEWYVLRILDGELSFTVSDLEAYMTGYNVWKKYSTIIMVTDNGIVAEEYEQMGVTHIVANIKRNY